MSFALSSFPPIISFLVVSNIFFMFTSTWGNDPIWLLFFIFGWNHQLVISFVSFARQVILDAEFMSASWIVKVLLGKVCAM